MKTFLRFVILSAIGFVLGAGFAFFQQKSHAVPAAEQTTVAGVPIGGKFSLTDHKGHSVTEKSWPGKYKLVFFGFTHCPDTCPATLQKIAVVMEHSDPQGKKIVPLFVTVDPATDTPPVMAKYVGAFNPHIIGLTGTEAQIKAAEDAYKVYASKVPGKAPEEDMVDHSAYIYLMSPDDKFLEVFSVDETAENMISKIAKDSVK